MSTGRSHRLLDPLFGTPEALELFSDRARLQGMLDFEAALARAQARTGVIPEAAADAIAAKCRAELLDPGDLAEGTAHAGNPAIPMVKSLTGLVAADDAEAARFVHWGATSQDAMDAGLVLQLRALFDLLDADLDRLDDALAGLVETHRHTPLAGRTWLQQALPTTFGLQAAGWLSAVRRHGESLREIRPRVLVLQFGGAVGTLAALGERGLDVAAALADELDLTLADLPWHAERHRLALVATTQGLLVGTLGKIARDVSLLMQTEVAEAFEPAGEGRGGSSTMPHKRNPLCAAVVLAAAGRAPNLVATLLGAMVQEHQRGLGGWHVEWTTLPELCILTAGALRRTVEAVSGLEVDAARMRANLEATRGQILAEAVMMALGERIGRLPAHDLIERACHRASAEGRHLREVLGADPEVSAHLAPDELERLLDPAAYLGSADALIERVLAGRERE